jgi:hypothetical protein
MAGKITGYWITYSGDLKNKTTLEIKNIFDSILQRPYIKQVYLCALVAAGLTYNSNSQTVRDNFGTRITQDDIFTIFKRPLQNRNRVRDCSEIKCNFISENR